MEATINYLIRSIFLLNEKTVPPALEKHLTQKIFNKPNKEAMEQVIYLLFSVLDPKLIKTIMWPIRSPKEAAEFRNAATLIINGLEGFTYQKSLNHVGKVNSSLLANPGGPTFVYFLYQFCIYVLRCDLKKKGISGIDEPFYIEDQYINNKLGFFRKLTDDNFTEVTDIINQVELEQQNTSDRIIKYKEIIQDSKQKIKDIKTELQTIVHNENTEKEVLVLHQQCAELNALFKQNESIAVECIKLADIILKCPEICDAEVLSFFTDQNREFLIGNNGKIHLFKLLTFIKNRLIEVNKWCKQLNKEHEEMCDILLETEHMVNKMTKQLECYRIIIKNLSKQIDKWNTENEELEKEVYSEKCLEGVDSRILSVYKKTPSIVLKPKKTENPIIITTEDRKKSRRSILLDCGKPYVKKNISIDEIKDLYNSIRLVEQDQDDNSFCLQFAHSRAPACILSYWMVRPLPKFGYYVISCRWSAPATSPCRHIHIVVPLQSAVHMYGCDQISSIDWANLN
ncbi:uncharacterized protein LOC126842232 isoform X2 [Adelges cooleyi]|uniref:uncharacterized protein LOC126842232 isoform X2 n=1 Tax=Adelges cooleyi TaxID=133065 RepID=UPI0021800DB1|nr:uncharacterized protein LOC126842232 isoform X2 [Adelges cooleyi]